MCISIELRYDINMSIVSRPDIDQTQSCKSVGWNISAKEKSKGEVDVLSMHNVYFDAPRELYRITGCPYMDEQNVP